MAMEENRNGNLLVTYFQGTPDDWNTKPHCSFKQICHPDRSCGSPDQQPIHTEAPPTPCLPKTIDSALTLETIPFSIVMQGSRGWHD
jgi:hypothetical protein